MTKAEVKLDHLVTQGEIINPLKPKGKLIRAAATLFCQQGYHNTTVREIAAQVGILSGSIFHHFKNKEDILFAIMQDIVITMNHVLESSLQTKQDITAQIRVLVETELLFIHGETRHAARVLLFEWNALNEDKQSAILQRREQYYQTWRAILEAAFEQGVITVEPDYLRQLIHGALVWTTHWYKLDGTLTLSSLTDQVMKLIIKD